MRQPDTRHNPARTAFHEAPAVIAPLRARHYYDWHSTRTFKDVSPSYGCLVGSLVCSARGSAQVTNVPHGHPVTWCRTAIPCRPSGRALAAGDAGQVAAGTAASPAFP